MKLFLALFILIFSGCAWQHTASMNSETHQLETFSQVVWFQKASVDGLKAHYKTKSGSSTGFSVSKEGTETQTEALAAVVKAAVEGAVKGAK